MTHWIAYAKARNELAIADKIRETGAGAWVARKLELFRAPTKRRWEARTEPFLPNYVFIDCTDAQWHDIRLIDGVCGTMVSVSPSVHSHTIAPFMDRVEIEYAQRAAQVEAGDRVAEYTEGDMLQIVGGPLAGMLMRFARIVEASKWDEIEGTLELFNRTASMRFDPINVRRAAE